MGLFALCRNQKKINGFLLKNLRNSGISQLGLFLDGPRTNLLPTKYFSTEKSSENQHEQPFKVSYLINSCGLSPEVAISASKKVHFTTPDKPDSVLAFFRNHGFENSHISKIMAKTPDLLIYNPVTILIPKLYFFRSLGLSQSDIVKLFSSMPHILRRSLENHIIPRVDFLKSVLVSDIEVVTSLKSGAVDIKLDSHQCIRSNMEVLRKAGVPYQVMSYSLKYHPYIFNRSIDHFSAGVKEVIELGVKPSQVLFALALAVVSHMSKSKRESKVEAFKHWGCSDAEVSAAFRNFPPCMLVSEKKIMSVMEYFVNKMGLKPSYVTRDPRVLCYSLEKRIIRRCSVVRFLQLKGFLKKDLNNLGFLKLTERQFSDKFVIKYKEEVPQLFSVYEGKVWNLKQGVGPEDLRGIAQSYCVNNLPVERKAIR